MSGGEDLGFSNIIHRFDVEVHPSEGAHIDPDSNQVILSRRSRLIIKVSSDGLYGDSFSALIKQRSLKVTLRTFQREIYRRFPFSCYIGLGSNEDVIRIIEFSEGWQEKTFNVPINQGGWAQLVITSELAGIPADLDLGPDERELALAAEFSVVAIASDIRLPSRELAGPWLPSPYPLVEDLPRPAFVVGMYRSGTSVLTWAIGQHPNLWPLEETGFLPLFATGVLASWARAMEAKRSFGNIYEIFPGQFPAYFGKAVDGLMHAVSKQHAVRVLLGRLSDREPNFVEQVQVLRTVASAKRRWVDGTPENTMAISQLVQLFPRAKFIHIVRDPVSVIASMTRFARVGGVPMSPEPALHTWCERVTMGLLAERAYGSDVVKRIRYEDLVAEPIRHMRDIFAFLDEPDFDSAGETFEVRLNSSKVTEQERAETEAALDPRALAEALELYARASRPLNGKLMPDSVAVWELGEFVNDQISRLLRQFS